MTILAIADLHGKLDLYKMLKDYAISQQVDAVVLAGDLVEAWRDDGDVEKAQKEAAQQIVKILESLPMPVYYIMGNDDLVELDSKNSHVQSIHGRRVILGDYAFVGYQFSLPFMLGRFEKPESDIEKDLLLLEPMVDQNTVFVTHSPAYGILDSPLNPIPGEDTHAGSKSILGLIQRRRVKAHIHGHIHYGFGRQGIHFNVAAAGRFRGMTINLKDLSHKVFDYEKKAHVRHSRT